MVSSCTRGGLDKILGNISSWKELAGIGQASQRRGCVTILKVFKRPVDVTLWECFSDGLGNAELMAGLDYPKGFFQK